MRTDIPKAIYRKDYAQPDYRIETVEIGFNLDPKETRVATRLQLTRNPAGPGKCIVLGGEDLELVQLRMNGKALGRRAYQLRDGVLRIADAPEQVTLEIETVVHPDANTSLMGLYVSNGN